MNKKKLRYKIGHKFILMSFTPKVTGTITKIGALDYTIAWSDGEIDTYPIGWLNEKERVWTSLKDFIDKASIWAKLNE